LINSVLKAIDIINLFSPAEPRLSLGEISRRLDLPKSTAHSLLATLHSRGIIEKVNGDEYALGTAIIGLTHAVRVNVEIRDRAAQLLRQLADATHESVYLTTLDGDYCLYIYAVESSHRLLARTAVGDRALLHCTSVGKAILAYLPEQQAAGIIGRAGLPAFTPHTITSAAGLAEDLAQIRSQGFALDREEHERGVFCVGAPIFDQRGSVIGSCSVSGTDPEILAGLLPWLSGQVAGTAHEISRRMGYVPASLSLIASALPAQMGK